MDTEEKVTMLQPLDEKTLTKRVIIPLYESEGMGCKNVQYTHKTLEFGKDVVFYKEDEYGDRIYTGIQVKKIRITTSKVDTLLRQIHEAFGEPFTDLSDNKKKELDKFVVITSREFSGDAKNSLIAALKSAHKDRRVKLIDGRSLVGLLENYLPSAFWEEYDFFNKYFQAMKKEFETIKDISALGQREPISLEEIYVSLKVSKKGGVNLQEKIDEEMADKRIDEHRMIERREQILDADGITDKFRKVVIVGGPGSGKTTLLKHLTLKSCKKNMETQERAVVPVFITLRQYLDSGKTVREYIDDIFERYNFPRAKKFIEADLKKGKCLLFLDGFDELASKERQEKVTKDIEMFVKRHPKNRFVVTSRTAGYHGELKGFDTVEVMPFDDYQIEQFITNWFGKSDPEKGKSMGDAVKAHESIRELARTPLMIAIIAVIYEEDKQLPQRRVKLYERCLEVLLSKWDVQKKIENRYDAEAKQRILRKVALKAHNEGKRSFAKEELLREFTEYLPEVRIENEKAEDVLAEIVERNVLLKEVSIGVYEFLHLSFQEYLAAYELRETFDYDTLLDHLYESWWEEVVLLFAGFDRNATELLKKIIEKEQTDERFREDMFYRNLTLMGKCIVDADYTSVELRNQIVDDLWSLYQTAEFRSLRERAMNILSSIKPDSIVDMLTEELKDKDSIVRWEAVETLGEIGSEKAVDSLIEALTDESSDVRMSVVIALREIGSEKAVDSLIKVLTDRASYVRGRAAVALGGIGSEKAVDSLIEALTDEGIDVRGSAAEALGEIGSEKAVDLLIEALTDESSIVRWEAAEALGKLGSEKAVDLLIEALTDESSNVRWRAAEALGKLGSEKAVDLLIEALTDESSNVRGSAAYALGKLGSEKAVDLLIEALTDESSHVRGSAAYALGKIGSEKAVDSLIEALTDESSHVRWEAAYALGKLGSEKAVDLLSEALTDESSDVRWSAAEALGKLGSEKAVDLLIEALTDESSDVRGRAAEALGKIGSEKAVDPLKKALKDDRIKNKAFDSLEKIGKSIELS